MAAVFNLILLGLVFAERIQEVFQHLRPVANNFIKSTVIHLDDSREFGVVAMEDIQRGEPIVGIPLELCLTSFDRFDWTELLTPAGAPTVLIGRLIYERHYKAHSTWVKTHINLIHPNNIAASWPEDDLKHLRQVYGQPFNIKLQVGFESGFKAYRSMLEKDSKVALKCPICLSKEAWKWGYDIVVSRSFDFPLYDYKRMRKMKYDPSDMEVKGLGYFPLLDYMPHAPLPSRFKNKGILGISFQAEGTPSAVLYSDRDVKAGQEVTWSYSNLRNLELLYAHGVVIERNPDEWYMISAPKEVECTEDKAEEHCLFKVVPDQINHNLMLYLHRLRNTEAAELGQDIETHFKGLTSAKAKQKVLETTKVYVQVVSNEAFSRCIYGFREVTRRLTSYQYKVFNRRLVDQLCLSHRLTQMQQVKQAQRLRMRLLAEGLLT